MDQEIQVSVICLVYNHEKYLRHCLDGFVMQKTNFKFEVLVHDDASTDHSTDIIREYERSYPEIIRPIYQTDNQYSKGINISQAILCPKAKGKYIAFCEGDDYWCDENKLQLQFDAMENNQRVSLCTHRVRDVSESGNTISEGKPYFACPERMTGKELLNEMFNNFNICPFHTSSFMIKAALLKGAIPEFVKLFPVGDIPYQLLSAANGDLIYIDKTLSCYRRNSIGSWSSRTKASRILRLDFRSKKLAALESFNDFTHGIYKADIEYYLTKWSFYNMCADGNYKLAIKKYKSIFNEHSFKGKAYYIVMGYFPYLYRLYRRIRIHGVTNDR